MREAESADETPLPRTLTGLRRVWMNPSTQPLDSDSQWEAGLRAMPRKSISAG